MGTCIRISQKTDQIIMKIKDDATTKEILEELEKKIAKLKSIYKEEKIPIYVTGRVLTKKEIEEIEKVIKQNIDVKVKFDTPTELGLHGIKRTFEKEIENSDTKFFKGSLRSGQRIEYEGSIVLMGDLNAGAEIVAGDNIAIVGALRGLAHAGAKGNKKAIISAGVIDAPQVRIANIIKEIEKEEEFESKKTFAYVDEEKIILE